MTMEQLARAVGAVRAFVWGVPMLALLLGTGVYFTLHTGVFQLRRLPLWMKNTLFSCFGAQNKGKTGVSPFAAACTALAATVGTGNIAGVATALTLGGPGAVFWMLVSAFFGMMTAFAENVLGMCYRVRDRNGAPCGGPMYYLKNGVGSGFLAGAFALFCMLASFGVGNMSQCNSIAQGLSGSFGVRPAATGLATAALLGAVLLGGLKRLTRVTSLLVPFMALFYMAGAVCVLFCFRENLPRAVSDILAGAFDRQAGAGGLCGYGMAQAVRVGVSRGVFSNEAGLGSSVMVHTAADADSPCGQGMWAIFEVFFDTVVMCSVTALVLLVSGAYDPAVYGAAAGTDALALLPTGAQLTAQAFGTVFGAAGGGFVAVSLALFAFSTLLGWSYYGARAAAYLLGDRAAGAYRVCFVCAAAMGCVMRIDLVWALSDAMNGLMALPNLVGVLALRREVLEKMET